jgi:hypothetical protein
MPGGISSPTESAGGFGAKSHLNDRIIWQIHLTGVGHLQSTIESIVSCRATCSKSTAESRL